MNIELVKCHGSGNDFFIIDEINHDYQFTEEQRVELSRAICNRDSELGSDGILFVLKSEVADGMMRMFNPDGSEASMCGNGLRCVARYVCELLDKEAAIIETMKANLKVNKEGDIFPKIPTYKVEISPVSFQLSDLPLQLDQPALLNEKIPQLTEEVDFFALAVPNPHLVAIVEKEQVESNLQKTISEYVNGPNELFPDGVNVSFVKPLKTNAIYVRTFERGVGFTNACGTAMSASSLVTCLAGINENGQEIQVYNNGGKVNCVVHEQDSSYSIDLIGNATYEYKVDLQIEWGAINEFTCSNKIEFTEEKRQYEKLQSHAIEFISEWL
ncbi:diaminopimelate epimerase [Cytobacillus spongiae]|uniref:diaminopimelate epimerase n=1 Tax=Cytobacillus spongiae TaxID=2901381 RepID=UPI001F38DFCD|nr:diaminopimelate epimerase [Cytobacillus spongiae]UII54420.1 diaminopimelate epimerase [Cytobacillus spongiae]